ncbi:hypothetical protein HHI36_024384 [Cryptolaemus montrouzieri]|uniref:Ig-like domain-containing protein n=1 Tax=Cryptolaemus montrouzieri TaxID=559131 RepID=A0ABD2N0T5_9CUCU
MESIDYYKWNWDALYNDEDPRCRELGIRSILKARERRQAEVLAFNVPWINFDAIHYSELGFWTELTGTELPLTLKSGMSLLDVPESKMDFRDLLCHTQAVERCVRLDLKNIDGPKHQGSRLRSYNDGLVAAVRLNRIVVPATGYSEKSLTLNCEFDLEGDELRSVKWFKDSEEFFRYMPNEIPKTISHRISGVQVDPGRTRCTDNSCLIVLNNLSSSSSSGRYQCEVTALHSEYRMAMKSSKVQIEESKGFRITNFTATTLYNTNKELELYCAFDLDKEELYALKFYRGVYEFFDTIPIENHLK